MITLRTAVITTLVLCCAWTPLLAQTGLMGSGALKAEMIDEKYDLTTVDGTVTALYDIISFEQGYDQDWDAFDKLFVEDARLSQAHPEGYKSMTPAQYEEQFKENRSSGRILAFQEYELHQQAERFGPIAHVFSTYQSKMLLDSGEKSARGINTIQLVKKDKRWWIVSILWSSEHQDLKIPSEYLK